MPCRQSSAFLSSSLCRDPGGFCLGRIWLSGSVDFPWVSHPRLQVSLPPDCAPPCSPSQSTCLVHCTQALNQDPLAWEVLAIALAFFFFVLGNRTFQDSWEVFRSSCPLRVFQEIHQAVIHSYLYNLKTIMMCVLCCVCRTTCSEPRRRAGEPWADSTVYCLH